MTTTYYYVNAFDNARPDWIKYGASPYLGTIDYPANYIFTGGGADGTLIEETGNYDFQNSGSENAEVIDSVAVEFYKKDCLNNPASVRVYVWNGSAWVDVGVLALSNNVWGWISIDVSSVIDSWSKVDGCRVYLKGTSSRATQCTGIDCARLNVVSHAAAAALLLRKQVGIGLG